MNIGFGYAALTDLGPPGYFSVKQAIELVTVAINPFPVPHFLSLGLTHLIFSECDYEVRE